MLDPIKLAEFTEKLVCKEGLRKYYSFRPARFYGGISTADCVGCCLRCVFCWSWNIVASPGNYGDFYGPEEVAKRLIRIAEKKGFTQIRLSGNEPTLCWEHLMRVLDQIPGNYLFILETNGVLIGSDESYARELSGYSNLYVRVSLKGTCEDEFSKLTGAIPEGFELQIKALENLVRHNVRGFPACMVSFSPHENREALKKRLKTIHPHFKDFEIEELILYPHVEEKLKKLGISYYSAHRPESIPSEQI